MNRQEKISLFILMISIINLSMVLLFNSFPSLPLFLFILVNLFFILLSQRISLKNIGILLLSSFCFSAPVGVIHLFFSKAPTMVSPLHFFFQMAGPLFLISFTSLLSAHAIHFEELLFILMKKRWIRPQVGYILIIAWQSIAGLQEEWNRIRLMGKIRRIRGIKKLNLIFNLFAFALRHSHRKSMALLARGVQDDKLFYR